MKRASKKARQHRLTESSAMNEKEIALTGGNTNAAVVRVGDTVRRAMRPSSATVHRLLKFLEQQGFDGSPKFLGIDAGTRETLSYIKGSCEISPWVWRCDSIVETTAHALRLLHDITARYIPDADDQWGFTYPDPTRHEVICHNDFGLYNIVTKEEKFTGVIDFDLAGPGPRIRDIAYAAYWLTPLSQSAEDMKPFALADLSHNCRRLKLFCNSYGVEADASLLDMVSEILHMMGSENAMIDLFGCDVASRLGKDGHLQHWHREALVFDANRGNIENAL